MCKKMELFKQKIILFSIIEEKGILLEMEKEKKDIRLSMMLDKRFFNYLQQRAENKNIKFMASRELYELAKKGMQLELNLPIEEAKSFEREKRALEVLDKIKRVIKEEGV